MSGEIVYAKGTYLEDEAIRQDHFQSFDQIELAAEALERAGFVRREDDEQGRPVWLVVRDVTSADLATALSLEHKRMEDAG